MNWTRRILPVAWLAALTGCSEIFTSGYDYGRIEVEAVDQDGRPAPGVTLTLYGRGRHYAFGKIGSDGRHVFNFVPFGSYGVEAGPTPEYRFVPGSTQHQYANIEEGDEVSLRFVVERVPEAQPASRSAAH